MSEHPATIPATTGRVREVCSEASLDARAIADVWGGRNSHEWADALRAIMTAEGLHSHVLLRLAQGCREAGSQVANAAAELALAFDELGTAVLLVDQAVRQARDERASATTFRVDA